MRAVRLLVAVLGAAVLGGCAHAGAAPSTFPGEAAWSATAQAPVVATATTAATSPTTVAPTTTAPRTTAPTTTAPTTTAPTTTAPTTTPPARPATPAGLAAGTPCRAVVAACVQLSTKQAWLIRDGKVAYGPVPITSGRPGWRTPPGTFAVTFKNIDHRSSLFDGAPMPYSVFFNGGIAFHQGSLSVQSHGCIHLSRAAARTFFSSLSKGSPVQVVA